jgi:protein transport protein SEC23
VVTTARTWGSGGDQELAQGFDQEAGAAAMALLAAFKAEAEEHVDVLRWVDRSLIKLGAKFGAFRKDRPESFALPDNFGLFPQFMFHLRRSQFLQVFNNTPDETAFARLWLERESTANALTMVHPALLSYGLGGPPHPVQLDVSSIQPERILLLDAFFLVVVFLGSTVDGWRRAGYHENPAHAEFAELLEAPLADAAELTTGRLPVPRIVRTEHNGSQARFLLAKLNPSSTHESQYVPGEIIFTDDVSLQVFLEHLAKLAVSS